MKKKSGGTGRAEEKKTKIIKAVIAAAVALVLIGAVILTAVLLNKNDEPDPAPSEGKALTMEALEEHLRSLKLDGKIAAYDFSSRENLDSVEESLAADGINEKIVAGLAAKRAAEEIVIYELEDEAAASAVSANYNSYYEAHPNVKYKADFSGKFVFVATYGMFDELVPTIKAGKL